MATKTKPKDPDYVALLSYIKQISPNEPNWGFIMKQIKEYTQSPYNYKYKAILATLHYWIDDKEQKLEIGQGIGIVPYIYNEAKEYWEWKHSMVNKVNNADFTNDEQVVVKKIKKEEFAP